MSDPLPPRDEDMALAGEYVLGVLDAAERAVVEHRMSREPALAALVARWERDFSALDDGFAPVTPPDLWPRIEARVFGRPARPRRMWRWLLGAGTAAALALTVVAVVLPPAPVPAPALTATLAADGEPLVYAAVYDQATGELVIRLAGGEAAPAGLIHQLWLIEAPAAPVSLGLLSAPEIRHAMAPPAEGAVLAVSLEPAGGSPTGLPTGPVLVTGVVSITG